MAMLVVAALLACDRAPAPSAKEGPQVPRAEPAALPSDEASPEPPEEQPPADEGVITLKEVRRHPDPRPKVETYGLVRAVQVLEECSGLGGTHVVLEVVRVAEGGPALEAAYHGGHGYRGIGGTLVSGNPDPAQLDDGPLFVAGLAARKSKDEPGLPDTVGQGWCLDGLRTTDAVAVWLAPVASAEEGSAILDALAAGAELRLESQPED